MRIHYEYEQLSQYEAAALNNLSTDTAIKPMNSAISQFPSDHRIRIAGPRLWF
jgi:hypothetical protein